jgi:hypothetical protein
MCWRWGMWSWRNLLEIRERKLAVGADETGSWLGDCRNLTLRSFGPTWSGPKDDIHEAGASWFQTGFIAHTADE